MSIPSALAVLRLMTSSYFDTCSTGRSTLRAPHHRPRHCTAKSSDERAPPHGHPSRNDGEAHTTSAFRAYSMISVAAGASGRPCAGYYAARKSTHPVSHITPDPRRTVLIAVGRRST